MKLKNVRAAISCLPILGVFDVVSTLYVSSLGYPLEKIEVGFLASFFARKGLLYLYIPVYMLILCLAALFMLYVEKSLDYNLLIDRIVLILLVGAVCTVDSTLISTIISNLAVSLQIQMSRFILLKNMTFVTAFIAIFLFLFNDLKMAIKTKSLKNSVLN